MEDMFKYKGYYGSIHFEEYYLILFGKVEFVKALISYEIEYSIRITSSAVMSCCCLFVNIR